MKRKYLFFLFIILAEMLFGQLEKDLSKENPSVEEGAEFVNSTVETKESKLQKFNKKAEKLFVYIPVPIVSYSQETGNTIGLAKFNMVDLYKDDTVTTPSKFNALATFSSLGNVKLVGGWNVYLKNDLYITSGTVGYKFFPEYILGTGNRPNIEDFEEIENEAYVISLNFAKQIIQDNFFGIGYDFKNFVDVNRGENSYLDQEGVIGGDGGKVAGVSFFYVFDNRINRYTPSNGGYLEVKVSINGGAFGSDFNYTGFSIDGRKYFKVFNNHVIALQGFWSTQRGETPFFDLCKLGGDSRMRGYYEGAIRDENIFSSQVEYRMPVWNIFGVTAWVGHGKVYASDESLNFQEMWISYGVGLRVMVDSKSQTNLRFDVGFNQYGSQAFIINFTEAF